MGTCTVTMQLVMIYPITLIKCVYIYLLSIISCDFFLAQSEINLQYSSSSTFKFRRKE